MAEEKTPEPIIKGDWFDQETRDKVNKAADKQHAVRPFNRSRDQK